MKKKVLTIIILLAFIAKVSAQIEVHSSNQVGIGTTNPQYKLHVVGDAYVTGNLYLKNASNTTQQVKKLLRDVQVGDDLGGKTIYFDTSKILRTVTTTSSSATFFMAHPSLLGPEAPRFYLGIYASGTGAGPLPYWSRIQRAHIHTDYGNIWGSPIAAYWATEGGWLLSELDMPAGFIVDEIQKITGGYPDIDDPVYFSLADAWYFEEVAVVGIMKHNDLKDRADADAHPTLAITGLDADLAGKQQAIDNLETRVGSMENLVNFAGSNTTIGYNSLAMNTTGNYNTSYGYQALGYNTTGDENTAYGASALLYNTTGNYNTAISSAALYFNTTGIGNTATGYNALQYNTTGSYNTANGYHTLYSNTTGSRNIANGYQALYSNTAGSYNTANGYNALQYNTTGSDNIAIGYYALYQNTTGSENTAIGESALQYNTTGHCNTAIGAYANVAPNTLSYATAIGAGAYVTSSDQVRIGDNFITSIGGCVAWSNLSDGRIKKNIRKDVPGLTFINSLQPVTYNLDLDAIDNLMKIEKTEKPEVNENDSVAAPPRSQGLIEIERKARETKQKQVQTGFVAQDVEKAAKSIGYDFSGIDVDEIGIYSLRYAEFVVPLVKAVQELSDKNDRLQEQNSRQQEQIDALIKRIEALEKK